MKNRLPQYPVVLPSRPQPGVSAIEAGTIAKACQTLTDRIVAYPATSMIVMATFGAVVGWYLKRR